MDEAISAYEAAGQAMVARRDAIRRDQVAFLTSVLDLVDAYPTPPPPSGPADERVLAAGARGTGDVGEFVSLDVAARLGISRPAAWSLIHDAANLRARHPILWAAFTDLKVEDWQARHVARACTELDADAARWVDEQLAPTWGAAPWARITRRLDGLVVRADRELAARKAEAARSDRYVAIRHLGNGTAGIFAQIDSAAALTLAAALDSMVDQWMHEGAAGSRAELRARGLELLVTPQTPANGRTPDPGPGLPLADVVIHLAAEDLAATGTGVARMITRGGDNIALLTAQIAGLLGHHRVRVIPVIDLAGDPSVDSYEIPDRIRRQLLIREACSVFPYSTTRTRTADLDHTIAYRRTTPGSPAPPGQTRISNLGPLARGEHRAKTAGAWRVAQPAPGLYIWTDRAGHRWAVVGGHTHRLPDTDPSGKAPVPDTATPRGVAPLTGAAAPPHPPGHRRIDFMFC